MGGGAVVPVVEKQSADSVLAQAKSWLWRRYWEIHDDPASQEWKADDAAEWITNLRSYERYVDWLHRPPTITQPELL